MNPECAYCDDGGDQELTRDHVPPKSLFGRPLPKDLITVPCCLPCNREWFRHDEYFQLIMKMGVDRDKFPDAVSSSVRAINNLTRAESRRYAAYLWKSVRLREHAVIADRGRIESVLRRIVRGLYYNHAKRRLPADVPFRLWPLGDSSGRERGIEFDATDWIPALTYIGGGEFGYCLYAPRRDAPFATISMLDFYQHRKFLCASHPNALAVMDLTA